MIAMKHFRRHALAGVLAGSTLVLTACAVPGQPANPGTAARLDDTVITNAQVSDLYDVWLEDIGAPANRRQVITLELMRQPLIDAADQVDFDYSRSLARTQAQSLLDFKGITSDPSEAMIDAVEGSILLAAFTVLTEDTSVIESVAAQVEADAITSARTGTFSADAFMQSLDLTTQKASEAAQQGQPTWFLEFNDVVGLLEPDVPWVVSE
jgi:hypothetical protein